MFTNKIGIASRSNNSDQFITITIFGFVLSVFMFINIMESIFKIWPNVMDTKSMYQMYYYYYIVLFTITSYYL